MSTEQLQPNDTEDTERLPSLTALQALHRDLLQARRRDADNDEAFDRAETLIRCGQLTGAVLDSEGDRSTAQAILDYWSAILFKAGRAAPDATLADFDPNLAPEIPDTLCPYVGMDAFQERKRDVFFGRERTTTSLLERIADGRLLVVAGPSGCGKSSVVLAGLLPALKNGALPDSQYWRYAPRMVPGSNPLANLVRVMLAMQAERNSDPAAWAREQEDLLRQNPGHLVELANGLTETPIVGVVDQFEEVFTLCSDDATRLAFLDNLANLVRMPSPAHRVILTMRSDFEPFVARFPEFQALFESATVRVTPLTAAELRDAIEKPAENVGLKFEEGLVDQLLHDVLGELAALPLLQFTLLKLWDHRERNRITWQAYNKLGGGRLALARSADDFYDNLILEDQTTSKRIFLRLVRPGEGLEFTSNRVRLKALYEFGTDNDLVQRVIDKLITARLVRVTEGDIAADTQIEVAHEALVRNWPRLVKWLEEERHILRQRQAVTDAAERWNASGRDPGALYTTDHLLAEALRVLESSGIPPDEEEAEFMEASRRVQEEAWEAKERMRQRELEQAQRLAETESLRARAQTRAANRLWFLVGALFVLVLGAIVAIDLIQNQRERAVRAQSTAVSAQSTAELGATQVAARLQSYQDSLGAQLGSVEQIQTVAAENALLIARIQTLEARSAGTSMPVFPAVSSVDVRATQTAIALEAQREQIQAIQTVIALTATPAVTPSPIATLTPKPAEQLTSGTGRDYGPVYAPDGQQVAYSSDRGGSWLIYLLTETGEIKGPLFGDLPEQHSPHFSPEGWLAYASNVTGQFEIYLGSPDNAFQPKQLSTGPGDKTYPVFSPDGKSIVFMRLEGRDTDVYLMRNDGTDVQRLTDWSGYDGAATFSPDGQRLVFQTSRDGNFEIYSMDLKGSDLHRLTWNAGRDADPVWSPDEQWIAFETNRDGAHDIYVMRPDGSDLRNITQSPSNEWAPSFSPDGQWLIYQSDRSDWMNIWRQPFDPNNAVVVTSSDLEALILEISVRIRTEPTSTSDFVETVKGPARVPVVDVNGEGWIRVQTPQGKSGWLPGYWVVYAGNGAKLPANLRYRVITSRSDLPFMHGVVVSPNETLAEHPLLKLPQAPGEEIVKVPTGARVLVLSQEAGATTYGSGKWYVVTLADPHGGNQVFTGYLPVEAVTER